MACNCGTKPKTNETWKLTLPGGQVKVYATELEATAEAMRSGGTVRKQS